MGTKCLTVFEDRNGKEIAVLYRHFDGYPSGHGQELAEFIKGKGLTNGISGENFNGMNDLAVRVITALKGDAGEAGQFYLYPAGTRDCGEEYIYTLRPNDKEIELTAAKTWNEPKELYRGSIDEYEPKEYE